MRLGPVSFIPALGAEDEADGKALSVRSALQVRGKDSEEEAGAYPAEEEVGAAFGIPPVDLDAEEVGPMVVVLVVVLATI